MKQTTFIILVLALLVSCRSAKMVSGPNYGSPNIKQELKDQNTFVINLYSNDETYGYTTENPVMVGNFDEGPQNERRFLNALTGPNGEQLEYYRIGSCCNFETKNSPFGGGLLDQYNVSYKGQEKDLVIYINMYDSDTLYVPVGLKLKE